MQAADQDLSLSAAREKKWLISRMALDWFSCSWEQLAVMGKDLNFCEEIDALKRKIVKHQGTVRLHIRAGTGLEFAGFVFRDRVGLGLSKLGLGIIAEDIGKIVALSVIKPAGFGANWARATSGFSSVVWGQE